MGLRRGRREVCIDMYVISRDNHVPLLWWDPMAFS